MARLYLHRRSHPGSKGACELGLMPRIKAPAGSSVTNNRRLVVDVLDQSSEGACEPHGWTESIQSEMVREASQALAAMNGITFAEALASVKQSPPELACRQFIYEMARFIDGSGPRDDPGTCSSSIAKVLAIYGFPPESAWPYVAGELDAGSKLEKLKRMGYDQRFAATARVDSEGMSVDECDAAISAASRAEYLLPFAIDVDQGMEDLKPGEVWPGPKGPILGGHCTTIVGRGPATALCPAAVSNELCYLMLNSWGRAYCDNGYYLMSAQAVEKRYDVYCATKTPTYSGTV